MTKRTPPFSPKVRERAVRMVLEHAWSGAMTPARVAGLLAHLPDGLTELYTHPATGGGFAGEAPGYAYAAERDALIAPATLAAAASIPRGGFSDFLT